ncbi:MAG: efflux RND transporter permease subunit, partial [Mesorhizobium sp.]
ALTVAISFGISAFVSLTLTPALSAAFLRHRPATQFVLFRWFNTGFERLSNAYAHGVRFLIRLRWIMLGLFAAGLVATYFVWQRLP